MGSIYYPSPYMPYVSNYYASGARRVILGTVLLLLVFLIMSVFLYHVLLPKFELDSAVCSKNFVVISLKAVKGGNFINMPIKLKIGDKILTKKFSGSISGGETLEVAYKTYLPPKTYRGEIYVAERLVGDFQCTVK